MTSDTLAPLVDERVAQWAAAVVAPRVKAHPEDAVALRADVAADMPRIEQTARRWTDLDTDGDPVEIRVVGRLGWVRANLTAMRGMFEPLRERIEGRPAARQVLGAQLGALFGLLSTKVLGQYVLPLGGPGGGQLVVVGPNLVQLSRRHGPLARDMRRAVLLHEVTHALQFSHAPWLEHHLRGLIDRYLSNASLDAQAVRRLAASLPETLDKVRRTGTIEPVLEVILTDEQLGVLDEAQGMMSLLEGHANTVMFDAPAELVGDAEAVRSALASRHGDVTSRLLGLLAGLDIKRRQYRDGETFVRAVVERAGVKGVNLAFDAPANLPRAEDVADPDGWLDRLRAA